VSMQHVKACPFSCSLELTMKVHEIGLPESCRQKPYVNGALYGKPV
jgi:hypothetical protein